MANKKTTNKINKTVKSTKLIHKKNTHESDGAYFLKIVLFLILSSLWLRIDYTGGTQLPLPVGAAIAAIFALHDHFQIDRKIELALILVGMFISFWLPIGIFVSL
jgi:hypothetical protein